MTHIVFRHPLAPQYQERLKNDFPEQEFFFLEDFKDQQITDEVWANTEVLYSSELLASELAKAPMLRWIHSPHCNLDDLCLEEIFSMKNILVTCPHEPNVRQIGEYVMATVFAFSKQLFLIKKVGCENPADLWDAKIRETSWILGDKIFLQIGLDNIGTEVARCAHCLGMKVRGVHHRRSFHPYCEKVFGESELHSILPGVDVVSVSLPCSQRYYHWIGEKEFELMKDDAILVVVHCGRVVDRKALEKAAGAGKFRGIVLDAYENQPPSRKSPLWKLPRALLTPQLAGYPHTSPDAPFQNFCHNLHSYLTEAYDDLKDIVDKSVYSVS